MRYVLAAFLPLLTVPLLAFSTTAVHNQPTAQFYHITDNRFPYWVYGGHTPRVPRGALVLPSPYTVKLITAGQTYSQAMSLRMDPRVKASRAALTQQLTLSLELTKLMSDDFEALTKLRSSKSAAASAELQQRVVSFNTELASVFEAIQGTDNAPTTQAIAAVHDLESRWKELEQQLRREHQ